MPDGPPHDDLPERIGPYEVVDRIGEGGMGAVYAGRDGTGRKVAIKVIRRQYAADPQYRARFESEVAAAKRVRPFCTAPVLDADPTADPPYLVTEFVSGSSLQDAVDADGPLRGADLEALAVGMASALTAIHDARVVHRDLKPANVLLSPYGPRVIDFGIARSADSTRLTVTGGIVGTPAFMAPEQLYGESATAASDVFAWGATVAFAARGGPCFGGTSIPAVIHQIVSAEPDLRGLDGGLLSVVRKALSKDPAKRPTAHELLQSLVSGGTPPATSPSVPQQTSPRPAPPPPSWNTGPPANTGAEIERQYRMAAEAGDTGAMYNLGVLLSWRGQTAEADYWYRRAASVMAPPRPMPHPSYPGAGLMTTPPPPVRRDPAPRASGQYNACAVASFALALVGLLTCGITAIPAIITGHIGLSQVRRTGQLGGGLALAGIIIGWLMTVGWLILWIAVAANPS